MILLRLLFTGPLHPLLGSVKDQCIFLFEVSGKFGGVLELAFRMAVGLFQGMFKDLQTEFLISLRIGGIHSANQA